MTDMRATERLLEVIQDQVSEFLPNFSEVVEAIQELRRRGDTLVRAADLRLVLDRTQLGDGEAELLAYLTAVDRIENALGGACHIEKPA